MKKFLTCLLSALLAVLCLFICVGCKAAPARSINEADAALSYRGYTVTIEYGGEFDELIDVEGVVKKSLYAEKGEDYIEIYEFENWFTARRAYKLAKTTYKNAVKIAQSYVDFYEHILDKYDLEMTSAEIDEMQDELKYYRKHLKEAEEKLKSFGRRGKFVWFASDVDVVKDAQ